MIPENKRVNATDARVEGVRLFLALSGWVLGSIVVGVATYTFLPAAFPEWAGDISRLSAVIVAEVYVLLIVAVVVTMGGIVGTLDRLRVHRVKPGDVSVTLALWAGAYLVAFTAYGVLSAVFPAFPSASELARFLVVIGTDMGRLEGADAATWGFVVVRACVLAPVAEELLFRGALFGWLRERLPARSTIGLTAVGFAGIHGISGTMVPLALLVGIAAGYARERTGSVTAPVVVHLVQNLVVVLVGVWSLQ